MKELEEKIRHWEGQLRRREFIEDGQIEELVAHLRDRIDILIDTGLSPDHAFDQASRELGDLDEIDQEFFVAKRRQSLMNEWLTSRGLFNNYLRSGWRNFKKNGQYFFINALGLGIGLFTCLWTVVIINDRLDANVHHQKRDRIYQIHQFWNFGSFELVDPTTAPAFGPELSRDYPEIEESCRIWRWNEPFISNGTSHFFEERFAFTDPTITDLFTFNFIEGKAEGALIEPYSVVITSSIAKKYFGDEPALGKSLFFQDSPDAKQINNRAFNGSSFSLNVTGVIKDPPHRSVVDAQFFASFSTFGDSYDNETWAGGPQTFVLLGNPEGAATLESKLVQFLDKYIGEKLSRADQESKLLVRHIDELRNEMVIVFITLGSISGIVLLISCINFTNLATARSFQRAKEVGIRKVNGASRAQLIIQFLTEAFFLTIWSLPLAILFLWLSKPLVEEFVDHQFTLSSLLEWRAMGTVMLILSITSLVSGIYPALFLSRYEPEKVLKGNLGRHRNSIIHRVLVVSQFMIAIIALCTVTVLHRQLQFAFAAEAGFEKSELLIIPGWSATDLQDGFPQFKNRASQLTSIEGLAITSSFPGYALSNRIVTLNDQKITIKEATGDEEMISTFGFGLLSGRSFHKGEKNKVVINEAALSLFEFQTPNEALGQIILEELVVVGVVENFQYYSVAQQIDPVIITPPHPGWNNYFVAIKLGPNQTSRTLHLIEDIYHEIYPGKPYKSQFVNDMFREFYDTERLISKLLSFIALMTMFIACIGLIGLSGYSAGSRTKEIGVRKLLGAKTQTIVLLLSKEYMILIGTAFALAAPIAYLLVNEVLSIYAYRITVNSLDFLTVGLVIFFTALSTVILQVWRTAEANPARSLRYE